MEAGRKTEIRQLDVSFLVNEDVVRLDVTGSDVIPGNNRRTSRDSPVDEAQLVDGFNGENTLCDVETSDIFREGVVLDQHRHEVASGEELHDEVQILGVLEGVVELDDPWGIRLGQDIALCAYVGELWRGSAMSGSGTRDTPIPGPFLTSRPSGGSSWHRSFQYPSSAPHGPV